MVVIPAGTFVMGSPENEPGRFDDEGPQRQVSVSAFAVSKHPVTRREWAAYVEASGRDAESGCHWAPVEARSQSASWRDTGFPQSDDHPVVCVSWLEAQDYVRWLSERTGQTYRLLSEAEWEYAARAGAATPYHWGEAATHEQANYGADECCGVAIAGRDAWEYTSPVGAFPANAFGLHDMPGNVLVWVGDCYAPTYEGRGADAAAYTLNTCESHVVRGAAWGDYPALLRSAARNWAPPPGVSDPNYRSGGIGLRVARQL